MARTQQEADIINRERERSTEWWQEQLKPMGFRFRIAHFSGDSSYPVEYSVSHGIIGGSGPTFDLALLDCIRQIVSANARLTAAAIQLLTDDVAHWRAELLAVKALGAQEGESGGNEL